MEKGNIFAALNSRPSCTFRLVIRLCSGRINSNHNRRREELRDDHEDLVSFRTLWWSDLVSFLVYAKRLNELGLLCFCNWEKVLAADSLGSKHQNGQPVLELLGDVNTPSHGDEPDTYFGWRLGNWKFHLNTPTSLMEELSKRFPNEQVQQHLSKGTRNLASFNIKLNMCIKRYIFLCLQLQEWLVWSSFSILSSLIFYSSKNKAVKENQQHNQAHFFFGKN